MAALPPLYKTLISQAPLAEPALAAGEGLNLEALRARKWQWGIPFRKSAGLYRFFALTPRDFAWACLAGLAVFAVLLHGVCSILFPGDSGELIAAAQQLGISHPTGYPAYLTLCKGWSLLIPFANSGFRLNVFSAIWTGAAAGVLFLWLVSLTGSRLIAAPLAIGAALATMVATEGVVAEVYAFQGFLTVLVLLFMAQALALDDRRYRLAAVFLLGLGMAHHLSTVYLIAAVALLAAFFAQGKRLGSRSQWFTAGGLFLSALLLYVYLPIRASRGLLIAWGRPDSWGSFWVHVTGSAYRDKMFSAGAGEFFLRLGETLQLLGSNSLWLGALCGFAGLILLILHHRALGLFLTTFFGLTLLGNLNYGIVDIEAYYLPLFLAGTGPAAYLLAWLGTGKLRKQVGQPWFRVALFLAGLGLAGGAAAFDSYSWNRSNNFLAFDYAQDILKILPPRSTVFCIGDNAVFPLAYLQAVENYRPDVTVIHRSGLLFNDIYGYTTTHVGEPREQVRNQAELGYFAQAPGPVYFTEEREKEGLDGWTQMPEGLLTRLISAGKVYHPPKDPWPYYVLRGETDPGVKKDDYLSSYIVTKYQLKKGEALLAQGLGSEAARAFQEAAGSGKNIGKAQYNIGYMYETQGRYGEAKQAYRAALDKEPDLLPAYNQLGAILVDEGNPDQAIQLYHQGMKHLPNSGELYLKLGYAQEKTGDIQAAANSYRMATQLDPKNPDGHNNLGAALGRLQQYEEAIRELQTALSYDPESVKTRNNLGVIFNFMGKYDFAVTEFEKVVSKDPTYAEAFANLGDAYMMQQNYLKAEENYKKALDLKPGLAQTHYNYGYLLIYQRHNIPEGLRHWETFVTLAPQHPQAGMVREEIRKLRGN